MRLDVAEDLEALAEFLNVPSDPVFKVAYRDGALWALARLSGRTRDDLAADLAARQAGAGSVTVTAEVRSDLIPATGRPTPIADAIPAVPVFDRDEMIRRAANPPDDAFGPAFLGLRVTRQPDARAPRAPTPSFTAAGAEAAAEGNPAALPIPPDELAAIQRERAEAAAVEMATPTPIPEDDDAA